MESRESINRQLEKLYHELKHWQGIAESDIRNQNWQGIAASNCTAIHRCIQTLQWVLTGIPISPVYNDYGTRCELSI